MADCDVLHYSIVK